MLEEVGLRGRLKNSDKDEKAVRAVLTSHHHALRTRSPTISRPVDGKQRRVVLTPGIRLTVES